MLYIVKSGDTLSRIAQAHPWAGPWQTIYAQNQSVIGANPNLIKPGQRLILADPPGSAPSGGQVYPTSSGSSFPAPQQAASDIGYMVGKYWWVGVLGLGAFLVIKNQGKKRKR